MTDTGPDEPENWKVRLQAAVAKLDEAIESGDRKPARRALEIVNQLLAESVVLSAAQKRRPQDDEGFDGEDQDTP